MPNVIIVSGGSTIGGLEELKQTTVPSNCRECVLITGLTEVSLGWSFTDSEMIVVKCEDFLIVSFGIHFQLT